MNTNHTIAWYKYGLCSGQYGHQLASKLASVYRIFGPTLGQNRDKIRKSTVTTRLKTWSSMDCQKIKSNLRSFSTKFKYFT